MLKLRKILIPVDFSKESELALEWAFKLGKEEKGAVLYLIHVLPSVPMTEAGLDIDLIVKDQKDKAKDLLEEWRQRIPPPLSSMVFVARGDFVRELCQFSRCENVDLIVMTTHGRQGITRVIHPNFTEKVVREAPCPVLVLHLNSKTEALARAVKLNRF